MGQLAMTETKKVLTIERAKWRRGGPCGIGSGPTALLNDSGFMCCLGFDALACGLSEAQIRGFQFPFEVPTDRQDYRRSRTSSAINEALAANDDDGISEVVREVRVREALLTFGYHDVVFV